MLQAININQLKFPKAGASATEALSIMASAEPDMKALERTIMRDPLVAAALLKYANSPMYRRAQEVANVPVAMRLLGLKSIRSAVVTAILHEVAATGGMAGVIMRHCFHVAHRCRLLAQVLCPHAKDDLEFLGLVHDVGMITLAVNYAQDYDALLADADSACGITQREKAALGYTHDTVGAMMVKEFRLPQLHTELVHSFHSGIPLLDINDEMQRDACILELAHHMYADAVGAKADIGVSILCEETRDRDKLLAFSGLTVDQYQEIQQQAQ
ncbi:MAG: HDOD domain-containing protein [Gammaproteobacteria bacterium]|nr:HDOD domain-containing protein [Gammaproteobacteria bacterium]MDH5803031.1 HDOD domain-containing protein [Gammaproteobacteria bacterium]